MLGLDLCAVAMRARFGAAPPVTNAIQCEDASDLALEDGVTTIDLEG